MPLRGPAADDYAVTFQAWNAEEFELQHLPRGFLREFTHPTLPGYRRSSIYIRATAKQ
jgi:hypothetical protein